MGLLTTYEYQHLYSKLGSDKMPNIPDEVLDKIYSGDDLTEEDEILLRGIILEDRKKNPEIVYLAELDADVDDVVAAEYLHKLGVLREVVMSPIPKTIEGKERKAHLERLGVTMSCKIPTETKCLFCGGSLTEVANYIENHRIDWLVMNGGFVGCNIVKEQLDKFKGKETVRTFNFNCNVNAADKVLKSSQIEMIMLVGKNVCHDEKNTAKGIWTHEKELFSKYLVKPEKRMHDLLAVREGLVKIGMLEEEPLLSYKEVYPYHTGLAGKMTEWGSRILPSQYRSVLAAIGWK